MTYTYQEIVVKIDEILQLLQGKLDEQYHAEVIGFYKVGEVKLAVEMMCEFIVGTEIVLSKEEFNLIKKLCEDLQLKEGYWRHLKVTS